MRSRLDDVLAAVDDPDLVRTALRSPLAAGLDERRRPPPRLRAAPPAAAWRRLAPQALALSSVRIGARRFAPSGCRSAPPLITAVMPLIQRAIIDDVSSSPTRRAQVRCSRSSSAPPR